jgi:hypothetical protein
MPVGIYQEGYDGTVAWRLHPKSGPTILERNEVKSRERDADMCYPARILDYFNSTEVVAVTDFEGHTCYHLKGRNKWGIVNEQFYDATNGLLVGYKFNSSWRGGPGDETEVFSDYKGVGGWLIPTRAVHKSSDGTQTETTTSVNFDDVADSVFTLPDAIKALHAKKGQGKTDDGPALPVPRLSRAWFSFSLNKRRPSRAINMKAWQHLFAL